MKKAKAGHKRAPKKPAGPRRTRRDTPVETPAAALAQRPADPSPVRTAQRVSEAALLRLDALETLEQAYEAWLELKLEHAAFVKRCAEERKKISQQGSFLVGAVRAAALEQGTPGGEEAALAVQDPELQRYLREAEEKLATASQTLEAELSREEAFYTGAFERIRAEVEARCQRILEKVRPRVSLVLRSLSAGRAILHVERVGSDEAVLLMYSLSGRVPSRYGFLFDDSTDDVMQPPQPLYPEEGVTQAQLRPSALELRELVERSTRVLPAKGFIPVFVARAGGPQEFYRLLQRGAVMEVELQDGAAFRSVLTKEEGERFAGHLLRQKLQGRIELEMTAG